MRGKTQYLIFSIYLCYAFVVSKMLMHLRIHWWNSIFRKKKEYQWYSGRYAGCVRRSECDRQNWDGHSGRKVHLACCESCAEIAAKQNKRFGDFQGFSCILAMFTNYFLSEFIWKIRCRKHRSCEEDLHSAETAGGVQSIRKVHEWRSKKLQFFKFK